MKRYRLILAAAAAAFVLGGCGNGGEKDMLKPYQVSYEMDAVLDNSGEMGQADFFAENLCVVTGEEAYTDELIDAGAAIIFNRTDREVLFSNHAYERLYPASLTKLMTTLVAIENGDLNATIQITQDMLKGLEDTSLANIQPGETYTLEQLLYGAMLPSGNDAATAIAYLVGNGNPDNFVAMMNEKAKQIGATGTHYVNPHGLSDDDHYTTAYDIYLVLDKLLEHEIFSQIVSADTYTAEYTDTDGKTGTRDFNTTVRYTSGSAEMPEGITVVGGKTGTTTPAGSCLALVSQDGAGKQYISVILKASDRESLYQQMDQLFTKINLISYTFHTKGGERYGRNYSRAKGKRKNKIPFGESKQRYQRCEGLYRISGQEFQTHV